MNQLRPWKPWAFLPDPSVSLERLTYTRGNQ
jgi:hypothetical protein